MRNTLSWIQKQTVLLLSVLLAIGLAGCAGPTSPVTASTSSTTSAKTSNIPTVNPTFQKQFIAWAEACQAYALGAYGATTAIAGNKIKPSAFPKIKDIIAATTPLCHTYPTNPQQIDVTISEATLSLAQAMQENMVSPAAPAVSAAPSTTTQGATQ